MLFKKEFGNLEKKKQPAKAKLHQSYKNASNQYFLKRNLERKKQLQYNIQLQKCKNMMMLPRHHFPSHSPNHAYMHETVHLEPPPNLEKATSKKQSVYQKLQKRFKSMLF